MNKDYWDEMCKYDLSAFEKLFKDIDEDVNLPRIKRIVEDIMVSAPPVPNYLVCPLCGRCTLPPPQPENRAWLDNLIDKINKEVCGATRNKLIEARKIFRRTIEKKISLSDEKEEK